MKSCESCDQFRRLRFLGRCHAMSPLEVFINLVQRVGVSSDLVLCSFRQACHDISHSLPKSVPLHLKDGLKSLVEAREKVGCGVKSNVYLQSHSAWLARCRSDASTSGAQASDLCPRTLPAVPWRRLDDKAQLRGR